MNLQQKTIPELITFRNEIDQIIEQKRLEGMQAAQEQIRKIALESGYTVEQLLGLGGKASKFKQSSDKRTGKVAAKYKNPVSGETWTGRGRRPAWVVAALDGGQSLEDFAI